MSSRRVAIYARLSVTTEESVSIPRQLESGRKYADARGWTVVAEAVDDGVSATKNRPEDRAGWRSILDHTEPYDAVVVWKVDRLARRALDFMNADKDLRERGAGLVAVEDPIDMTTAQGRAFATMLAVFAEMEAEAIRARVTAARHALVKAGRRVGGRPPLGFRNVKNPDGPGLVLAPDPEWRPVVEDLARRAMAGESLYSLTHGLMKSGIAPRARKKRKSDVWHEASVEAILRAPAIAGMTPLNGDVLRDADGLPIVDESCAVLTPAERRSLLATLDAVKRPGSRPRAGAEVALLYGLARCGTCNRPLHRATSGGGKYRSYRCQGKACDAPASINRDALEDYVTAEFLDRWGRLPAVEVTEVPPSPDAERLADVEAAIADTTARLDETDDEAEEDSLMERLRSLKAARRKAREAEHAAPEVVATPLGASFAQEWKRLADDVAARRDLLRSALEVVEVAPGGRRGRAFDPDRVALVPREGVHDPD